MANCNISKWLLGLIPLALIVLLVIVGLRPGIERDLMKRSMAALQQQGYYWAQIKFDGQDGILTGSASSPDERSHALKIVSAVSGVNSVSDRAKLLPVVSPYTWSANHKNGSVRVKGHVPTDADRQIILGIVKANLPGMEIEDRMKLAAGAPPRQRWIGAISFALKQLAHLKRGNARILDMEFVLVGEAADALAYTAVTEALSGSLPAGLSIKHHDIAPARAKPYAWGLKKQNGTVTLRGHVPSEEVRKQVLERVRSNFPGLTVVDGMVLGSGVPKNWFAAVFLAIGEVAKLEEGEAVMQASDFSVNGLAADAEVAKVVTDSLRKGLPDNFSKSENIKVLKKTQSEENPKTQPVVKPEKTAWGGIDNSSSPFFLWGGGRVQTDFDNGHTEEKRHLFSRHDSRPEMIWPLLWPTDIHRPLLGGGLRGR